MPAKNYFNKKSSGFSVLPAVILISVFILAGLGAGIFYIKNIGQPGGLPVPPGAVTPEPNPVKAELVSQKFLIKSEDIVLEKAEVSPKVPEYGLPLKNSDISNFTDISKKISIDSGSEAVLEKNGFSVFDTPQDFAQKKVFLMSSRREASPKDDFVAYYKELKNRDIPIFVTSDSLLHYYHIFFDTTLMKLERDLFYDDIWSQSNDLLAESVSQYNETSGDLKEAAKRNAVYFSVAMKLLQPKPDQIFSDDTLRGEYCQGADYDFCEQYIIPGVKEQYGESASFKSFSKSDAEKYSFEIPDFAKVQVEKEIALIEKHEGWSPSPLFIYQEDYSQYVPRGHYSKTEKLKNYFKAMMWYGRMAALAKGSPNLEAGRSFCTGPMNGIISEYDAKIQTLQASLIAKKFLESGEIQEKWQRIYAITSFFVGFSDDLGPYEYGGILKKMAEGGEITLKIIEERYEEAKNAVLDLAYNPKIYGGLGACALTMPCPPLSSDEIDSLKIQAAKLLEETKGFRLMGQRFTVDSYLFSEIVSPYSGEYTGEKIPLSTQYKPLTFSWDDNYSQDRNKRPFTWVKTDVAGCINPSFREVRGFPRGLDVFAIFGSSRAKEILENSGDTKYSDYEKKFDALKQEIDSFGQDDWFKNLYWNWLYVLKSFFGQYGKGYPTFMQTEAWQDKELNTALASWAELRHDTILYVKQSYTMAELGAGGEVLPVVGYVEPVPEFYARLLTLTKMTDKGLKNLVPREELEKMKIGNALEEFSSILSRLVDISKKELENKSLDESDYNFIENFGGISENLIENVSGGDVDPEIFKSVMVADVHTEGNTLKVLEEGVGFIKTMAVAYKLPQGHILLGVGPVFSYYEFKQPMKDRLTDEAWRKILESNPNFPEPEWTKSFLK